MFDDEKAKQERYEKKLQSEKKYQESVEELVKRLNFEYPNGCLMECEDLRGRKIQAVRDGSIFYKHPKTKIPNSNEIYEIVVFPSLENAARRIYETPHRNPNYEGWIKFTLLKAHFLYFGVKQS